MKAWLAFLKKVLVAVVPHNTYFHRLIWFGCLSVSIPIVLAGSVYYYFSTVKLTDQFRTDSQASLSLLKDRMENVLSNIEHESLKLAVNPLFKENLGKPAMETDIILQMSILDSFQLLKNADNFISEIVFYDQASGFVMSNTYGRVSIDNYGNRKDLQQAIAQKEPAKWTYLPESGAGGYITYVRMLPVLEHPQAVLLFHVKEDLLRKHLVNYATYSKNQSFLVLDSEHRIMLHSSDRSLLGHAAADVPGFAQILADEASAGQHMLKGARSESYLTVFDKTPRGRTYISQLPERDMLLQLRWIGMLVLFSVLIFLMIGIVLTLLASKRAYNPIEQLLRYGEGLRTGQRVPSHPGNEIEFIKSCLSYLHHQAETLENYFKKIQPNLRDQLLVKLLKGQTGNRESLLSECATNELPTEGSFIVLITIVENLYKEKRFLPSESAIVMFAVTNVVQELMSKSDIHGFAVEMNDKEGVAVLHFTEHDPKELILERAGAFAAQIQEALQTYLSFSVSIGIGGVYASVNRLSKSYDEAKLALQRRLFNDMRNILFYDGAAESNKSSMFYYPRDHERDIINALSRGELILAEQALRVFANQVKSSESYNTIFQSFHVLLSSIIQSLEEKGAGVIDTLGNNWFDQLKARQTSREIVDWFIEIIFPFYREITEEHRSNGAKQAIQKVCRYIKENPGASHTLVDCSEMVGISPSYLSRLFKKETGISFIDYVMEYKVERAKQLLAETDYSVAEISELVGYSERNLNRAFQRYVHLSPKQYRVSLR